MLSITLDDNGCPEYGDATKPGSGSSITALDFGGNTAYTIDTSWNFSKKLMMTGRRSVLKIHSSTFSISALARKRC